MSTRSICKVTSLSDRIPRIRTRRIMFRVLLILFSFTAVPTFAALNVVTTTADLEAIVQAISGGKGEVTAIAKGTQDPHQIEAKPSFMVKMRSADLVIAHGLELESAWINPLIQGGRNPKVAVGTKGYLELAIS